MEETKCNVRKLFHHLQTLVITLHFPILLIILVTPLFIKLEMSNFIITLHIQIVLTVVA